MTTPTVPEKLPAQSSVAILGMIDRLSANPDIDMDKIERFFALYEKQQAMEAEKLFTAAFADMQPELPVIDRKGAIRNRQGEAQSRHALWEDVVEKINPVLAAHGFALSFKPAITDDGRISVEAILSHRDGHKEMASLTLPHDSTGSKNAVQAIGSSTSYGKRYLAFGLLNIVARGEDDDGKSAAADVISDNQAEIIRHLIHKSGADINKFLNAFRAESISDLSAGKYDRAKAMLEAKARQAT